VLKIAMLDSHPEHYRQIVIDPQKMISFLRAIKPYLLKLNIVPVLPQLRSLIQWSIYYLESLSASIN
jgi:hypothetical protein